MITRHLARNRQFAGACVALFLFAIGMMGTLFMTVLAFVNLWGYSEIQAALAISPVPIVGLLTAPLVGRLANRVPPRVAAVPALLTMGAGLFWLSSLPAEPDYWKVVGPLCLMGAGMGATFPAVSIGSMGSITGQELGLGSGIVNMSRQVGFAVGVALLVAVFTGAVDNGLKSARTEIDALAAKQDTRKTQTLFFFLFRDPGAASDHRIEPRTPLEKKAQLIVDEHLRDAYGEAIRTAAFVALLAVPFSLTMRRRPGESASPEMAAAAAAATA
jgi:MFS family permease